MDHLLERAFYLILCIAALGIYFPMNRRAVRGRFWKTRLDRHIPLIPFFVIPYLLFFSLSLFGSLLLSFLQPIDFMRDFVISFLFAEIVSYLIFIIFPTEVEEFAIEGNSFFHRVVKTIYKNDKRLNSFPSLHVSLSIITSYYLMSWYPVLIPLLIPSCILICIATLVLKQHYTPDVPGGIIVAAAALALPAYFL